MKASIDIGTNTVLLLIGKVDDGLEVICEEQRTPRLGRGVDENGKLAGEAIDQTISVLSEYLEIINENFPEINDIRVTATSAVRDARNEKQFLQSVKNETGLVIDVLDGLQEARYTYLGALSVLPEESTSGSITVIDIGGGSTEIALGVGGNIIDSHSFDMGCVRFTERYLKNDPLESTQIEACRNAIEYLLSNHELKIDKDATLVGVAGTVTSLAFIDRKMDKYQSTFLNGHEISLNKLERYIFEFQGLTSEEIRKRYPVVMSERADIFRAGLLILESFMRKYGFKQVVTSTGGIRHGSILE